MNQEKRERLDKIKDEIRSACLSAGRSEGEVRLIAVSKTKPWEDIVSFYELGVKNFGENYVQEALAKQDAVTNWMKDHQRAADISWHFIGSLQSNKAKFFPGRFSLFHALDSLSLAVKLNKAFESANSILECLVEVNTDQESSKAGLHEDQLPAFLHELNRLNYLKITGLMCIPQPITGRDPRAPFAKMRELRERLNQAGHYKSPMMELSMGMSGDFSAAILEGATMVRIGTSLFGERQRG